jgi:hypothetical protein
MSGHSKRPSVIYSIVLMCPLLVAADLAAQGSKPQRTPGALGMGSSLGFGAAFPVIQNRPYIATVRVQSVGTTRAGVRVLHEALNIRMRDSAGRIRDEQLASTPDAQGAFTQGTVHILDPISMRDTQWNEDTKTVLASDRALFQVPTGYTDPTKAPSQPSSQTH